MDLEARLRGLETRLSHMEAERTRLQCGVRHWRRVAGLLALGGCVLALVAMAEGQPLPGAFTSVRLVDGGGEAWGELRSQGAEGGSLRLHGPRGSLHLNAGGLRFLDPSGRVRAALDLPLDTRPATLILAGAEGAESRLSVGALHLQGQEGKGATLMPASLRLQAGEQKVLLETSAAATRLLFTEAGGRDRAALEVVPQRASELRLHQDGPQGGVALRAESQGALSLALGRQGAARASLAVEPGTAALGLELPSEHSGVLLGVEGNHGHLSLETQGADRRPIHTYLGAGWDGTSLNLQAFGKAKGMEIDLPVPGGATLKTPAGEAYDSVKDKAKEAMSKGKRLVKKLF